MNSSRKTKFSEQVVFHNPVDSDSESECENDPNETNASEPALVDLDNDLCHSSSFPDLVVPPKTEQDVLENAEGLADTIAGTEFYLQNDRAAASLAQQDPASPALQPLPKAKEPSELKSILKNKTKTSESALVAKSLFSQEEMKCNFKAKRKEFLKFLDAVIDYNSLESQSFTKTSKKKLYKIISKLSSSIADTHYFYHIDDNNDLNSKKNLYLAHLTQTFYEVSLVFYMSTHTLNKLAEFRLRHRPLLTDNQSDEHLEERLTLFFRQLLHTPARKYFKQMLNVYCDLLDKSFGTQTAGKMLDDIVTNIKMYEVKQDVAANVKQLERCRTTSLNRR